MTARRYTAQSAIAPCPAWAPGMPALAGLLLLLALLLAGVPARAHDTGTDPAVVIDRFIQHYVVEPDGSYRLSVELAKTILQQRALRAHGQATISYNRSLDEVLSIEAWTIKPDGRRVAAQPGQVQDQQEAASASGEAPMFQDTRLKVVVFPEAAVGDRLVLRYVLRRKAALFPGHFEHLSSASFYLNRNYLLIYDMPASMPLHADAVGFVPVPGDSPPGRRRYQWRYVNGDNDRLEAGSVSYLDYGKRLAVSTFPDYAAFARARALALSDWVRHNIRGHCKDHAGLLEALLAAAGIDSTGALVNNGNAYRLPAAPTLGVLNHMITWVPSLGLYLDPTAETVGAGYLPAGILGKPVLLLKTGTFAMTPILQPERNRTTTWFDIRRDGRSRFKSSKTASGGGGEVRLSFSGTSDGFLDLPGPSGLATTHDLWGGLGEAVFKLGEESERRQDFVCPAIDIEDETGFRFPKGVRILAMPRPVLLMDGGIYYRARYARRGSEVVVGRRLTFRHGRATCTPADFRAMRPALERIVRDLRSQIVVAGS